MKSGSVKKIAIAVLSMGVLCGLAGTALGLWTIGWLLISDILISEFWCSGNVSSGLPSCDQNIHYGKFAVILVAGVTVLVLFSRRVLKGFLSIPRDRRDRLKSYYRSRWMIELLSLWIICGFAVTAMYMWLYGWFVLTDMWKGGTWCSEDIYADPTHCDHALYYGEVAVILFIGVAVPVYFFRRILKGLN